jgi:hypothetical protein
MLGEALACRSTADAKGRALLTLDLAECFAAEGEPEHAAGLGADALEMVRGSVVRPVLVRTQAVSTTLRAWKDARPVRDLGARLAEIAAASGMEG